MKKRCQVLLIWLGGMVVVSLIIMVGMKSSVERKMVENQVNDIGISEVDVKEYYEEKSAILDRYTVQDSSNTQTESQTKKDVIQRGFDQNKITYDYSIDGNYVGNQEAKDIKDKHPMYQTLYISSMGELWNIIIINGSVIANPVSYNMESELGVQTIISESKVIIVRIPLERNSLHASAGRLSAPNGKFLSYTGLRMFLPFSSRRNAL